MVQGFDALGLGLPWSLTLRREEGQGPWSFPNLPPEHRRLALTALQAVIELRPSSQTSGAVSVDWDFPPASGFGSSAAFCVALVRLLHPGLDFLQTWSLARHAEDVFHGRSSGVDVALAATAGLSLFRLTGTLPELEPLPLRSLALVVGSLARQEQAKRLIGEVHRRYQTKEARVVHTLSELGRLSREAAQWFRSSSAEPSALGTLADVAQRHLEALGLGHPAWAEIRARATRAGARGGKLSGAGGGGAFWFVAEDAESAAAVVGALRGLALPWLLAPRVLKLGPNREAPGK